MRSTIQIFLAVSILSLLLVSCEETMKPIGYSNPVALAVEANNWQSIDTIISIDPQTFEEEMSIRQNDFRPDTLPDGSILYQLTEYAPIFAGCETEADQAICTQAKLRAFVDENLEYPRWAQVRGVKGSSIATFVIGTDGRVTDTGVERSMGDELDKLVLRMVEQLPVWYPAFHKGKPVAIKYRLPVTFSMPADE